MFEYFLENKYRPFMKKVGYFYQKVPIVLCMFMVLPIVGKLMFSFSYSWFLAFVPTLFVFLVFPIGLVAAMFGIMLLSMWLDR